MTDTIIHVENLSKRYIIGHQRSRHDGLRHAVEEAMRAPLAWLRSRQEQQKKQKDEFWALKDVSFEVKQGEVVGIIGRNGAGKSTLLKILSRITEPTTGEVRIKGRVASLLEVGTGFHPDLTGRENVFLNGAILGMSRLEIKRKFDEIVAFSEIEQFIDTPVKRYSSGMYVRLAFAVAAHLEPEILIVDEVLAVGDSEFQKKCLGKMQDVAKHGRTVLFVSHNLGVISTLCSTGLLLANGRVKCHDKIAIVTEEYQRSALGDNRGGIRLWSDSGNKQAQIIEIEITDLGGKRVAALPHTGDWCINLKTIHREIVANLHLGVRVEDVSGTRIFTTQKCIGRAEQTCNYHWTIPIPSHFITPRLLTITAALHVPNMAIIDLVEAPAIVELIDGGSQYSIYGNDNFGCVFYPGEKNGESHPEIPASNSKRETTRSNPAKYADKSLNEA